MADLGTETQSASAMSGVLKPYESEYPEKLAAIKIQKHKEGVTREEDINKSLLSLRKADIFNPDRGLFAARNKEIYDYVRQNISKLKAGNPAETMELQNKLQQYEFEYQISKQDNENYQKIGMSDLGHELDDKGVQQMKDWYETPSDPTKPLTQSRVNAMPLTRKPPAYDQVKAIKGIESILKPDTSGGAVFDADKNIIGYKDAKYSDEKVAQGVITLISDPVAFRVYSDKLEGMSQKQKDKYTELAKEKFPDDQSPTPAKGLAFETLRNYLPEYHVGSLKSAPRDIKIGGGARTFGDYLYNYDEVNNFVNVQLPLGKGVSLDQVPDPKDKAQSITVDIKGIDLRSGRPELVFRTKRPIFDKKGNPVMFGGAPAMREETERTSDPIAMKRLENVTGKTIEEIIAAAKAPKTGGPSVATPVGAPATSKSRGKLYKHGRSD